MCMIFFNTNSDLKYWMNIEHEYKIKKCILNGLSWYMWYLEGRHIMEEERHKNWSRKLSKSFILRSQSNKTTKFTQLKSQS